MNDKAEYYVMKGMVSEMSPGEQAEVKKAEEDVIAIAKQSDTAMVSAVMAMIRLTLEK
ncbi:hypothetical protein G7009_01440 [Pseudomonas capeferrum]|uniref:hypothetical protein n=1 Tax=Pseudomonas capeferrum TaxID=1495066 RepID=UPI0015E3EAF0|nr:hypothetical protein [Pseudomonas capeferrum]MBA1200466.1 hypothetical protein [Pseudomonas capeferrum]